LESYYTYYDIAEKLNIGVDTVRRHVNKVKKELELNPVKQKTVSSKGSLVNCLSTDDTNTFINYFETKEESSGKNDLLTTSRYGFFYIIQLIPEFNPNRVKIGFADNVEKRLKEHQTASPTAKLVGKWNCKRAWDQCVMDSITRENCKLVLNEVYEGDLSEFIKRTDDFFANMPKPENRVILSEYSPMKKK